MLNNTQQQPRNVFEVINANIVALSEDLNILHAKIDEIHAALYGDNGSMPNVAGVSGSSKKICNGND